MQIATTRLHRRIAPLAATGLLGCLVALGGVMAHPTTDAHASAASLRYERGYSVQAGGWLCYGWRSGAYHCTRHWRVSGGRYVSLNPGWVPSEGSATSSSTLRPLSAPVRYLNAYPFGQCTYGAAALRPDENLNGLGNARDWLWRAQARGLPTGYSPRVGATVVFQPGVQGASWLGHVGHVVRIGAGGAFLMEAMNDSGGWGRYSFRWVHTGPGVGFIL